MSSVRCAGKVVAILANEGSVSIRKVDGSSLDTIVECIFWITIRARSML